jgi:hypothetical protein
MLGLQGFRVLEVQETRGELVVGIETIARLEPCLGCGVVATAHDRMEVAYRDFAAFGRPARLIWSKRRWRCGEPLCPMRTWTETSSAFSTRCLLTNRASRDCCLQVGLNARPVAQMARELGVCWDNVMAAVREHGESLVDDPAPVGTVEQLGVDETTWLSATRIHPTLFATGLVDLEQRIVIDAVNSGGDLGGWVDERPEPWCDAVRVVATDLAESYRSGCGGAPKPCDPRRRPVSRGAPCRPLPRRGAPAGAERDHRPPRHKGRPALPDPKTARDRRRTPGRDGA